MARRPNTDIPDFILRSVAEHPTDISSLVAENFGISRQAVNPYLNRLIKDNLLLATGNTKARSYSLKPIIDAAYKFDLTKDIHEDILFREDILPNMRFVRKNVLDVIQYGFSEMTNNVIDHSDATECLIAVVRNYATITITIADNGIGIFEKIRTACNLHDRRTALLELSKGKLTTDKARHTGEGIFFTSRMFDHFYISSSDLYYSRRKRDHSDWLIESEKLDDSVVGTTVGMEIATNADVTTQEVFEKFVDDENRFATTHVALKLAKYEGENLVSRSQARRLLTRVERFVEVILDFQNVPEVGRAFADEIFRVFQSEHPEVTLTAINTTPAVDRMIEQTRRNAYADEEDPSPL